MWIKIASFLLFAAVALGAFGAHALKEKLTPHYMDVYKTAVLYHMIHALGLFVIAWLSTTTTNPKIHLAGYFLLAGIILFSGSLYLLSTVGWKWLGPITPLGGLSFMIGWGILFFVK